MLSLFNHPFVKLGVCYLVILVKGLLRLLALCVRVLLFLVEITLFSFLFFVVSVVLCSKANVVWVSAALLFAYLVLRLWFIILGVAHKSALVCAVTRKAVLGLFVRDFLNRITGCSYKAAKSLFNFCRLGWLFRGSCSATFFFFGYYPAALVTSFLIIYYASWFMVLLEILGNFPVYIDDYLSKSNAAGYPDPEEIPLIKGRDGVYKSCLILEYLYCVHENITTCNTFYDYLLRVQFSRMQYAKGLPKGASVPDRTTLLKASSQVVYDNLLTPFVYIPARFTVAPDLVEFVVPSFWLYGVTPAQFKDEGLKDFWTDYMLGRVQDKLLDPATCRGNGNPFRQGISLDCLWKIEYPLHYANPLKLRDMVVQSKYTLLVHKAAVHSLRYWYKYEHDSTMGRELAVSFMQTDDSVTVYEYKSVGSRLIRRWLVSKYSEDHAILNTYDRYTTRKVFTRDGHSSNLGTSRLFNPEVRTVEDVLAQPGGKDIKLMTSHREITKKLAAEYVAAGGSYRNIEDYNRFVQWKLAMLGHRARYDDEVALFWARLAWHFYRANPVLWAPGKKKVEEHSVMITDNF